MPAMTFSQSSSSSSAPTQLSTREALIISTSSSYSGTKKVPIMALGLTFAAFVLVCLTICCCSIRRARRLRHHYRDSTSSSCAHSSRNARVSTRSQERNVWPTSISTFGSTTRSTKQHSAHNREDEQLPPYTPRLDDETYQPTPTTPYMEFRVSQALTLPDSHTATQFNTTTTTEGNDQHEPERESRRHQQHQRLLSTPTTPSLTSAFAPLSPSLSSDPGSDHDFDSRSVLWAEEGQIDHSRLSPLLLSPALPSHTPLIFISGTHGVGSQSTDRLLSPMSPQPTPPPPVYTGWS